MKWKLSGGASRGGEGAATWAQKMRYREQDGLLGRSEASSGWPAAGNSDRQVIYLPHTSFLPRLSLPLLPVPLPYRPAMPAPPSRSWPSALWSSLFFVFLLALPVFAAPSNSTSGSGGSSTSTSNSASSSLSVSLSLTTATTTFTSVSQSGNHNFTTTVVTPTTFNVSRTITPTSSSTSSASASATTSAAPDYTKLDTHIDPGFGVLGAILILTGLPSAFLGHKNRWTSFFLVGFYTLALVCFVLILRFGVLQAVNPPSTTLRGLFVLSCCVAGFAGGGVAIFFWKAAKYFIGAWGGFALALWIQCFRNGGLIGPLGFRWIMYIGTCARLAWRA